MKKKIIIILCALGVIATVIGIILLTKTKIAEEKNKIEILDATYACANSQEKFYEDDTYTYYFPCKKSQSVYVKLENGNKMLVVTALEEEKVTIDELIKEGLEVIKEEK